MSKPTVTITFTIEAIVKPDFLDYIHKDRSVRMDVQRALKEHNILRESEVVSRISVEVKGKQE